MVFAWNDNWRKHPLISNNMRFNIMLPGFTWGAAAFAAYLVGTKVMEVRSAFSTALCIVCCRLCLFSSCLPYFHFHFFCSYLVMHPFD
jgi:hypothetical protein